MTYDNGAQDTANGQLYPTKIDYTLNPAMGSTMPAHSSVVMVYGKPRTAYIVPNAIEAGALIQNTMLLTHIKTYSSAGIAADYRIVYQYGTHNEIQSVQQCDSDTGSNCLNKTQFNWQGSTSAVTLNSYANLR